MDQQDIRTLKILEEIEEDQSPSQRAIARKLNISLGLANSFITRLVNKGYFKITNIPANRVKYILTPKGTAEKLDSLMNLSNIHLIIIKSGSIQYSAKKNIFCAVAGFQVCKALLGVKLRHSNVDMALRTI